MRKRQRKREREREVKRGREEARHNALPRVPVGEQGGRGMSSPSRPPPPSSPRRVKASRYGLSRRTRTMDVQSGELSDYEADWPPPRWDGGVRLVDRSSWRKKRALLKEQEREKELFLFIRTAVPYAAAAAGRDCNRNIVAYAREAIGGERKRNIPSTAKPVYNFISRRPGAPRRDRRHAHLCVSWAPAQVASPFAAPQRLILLLLLPLLSLESLCRFFFVDLFPANDT